MGDKASTITEGKPKLVIAEGMTETKLLYFAASLERGSEYPLAAAIIIGVSERGIELNRAEAFQAVTGQLDGHAVVLGNRALLAELNIDVDKLVAVAEKLLSNTRRLTMMWEHMSGYGWGWMLFGGFHFIAFWLLIILAIAALLKWLSSSPSERPSASSKAALDILKERYARGEISREDYQRMRADLEK